MEVKIGGGRFRAFATVAALACWVAGCSRPPAATKTPASGYVAANTCAACHAEIAKSYRQTGMGRSFYRASVGDTVEDYAHNRLSHPPSGRFYTMIQRDGSRSSAVIRSDSTERKRMR